MLIGANNSTSFIFLLEGREDRLGFAVAPVQGQGRNP
jgi:hypothetical protein